MKRQVMARDRYGSVCDSRVTGMRRVITVRYASFLYLFLICTLEDPANNLDRIQLVYNHL
jgi:hypothetical protein